MDKRLSVVEWGRGANGQGWMDAALAALALWSTFKTESHAQASVYLAQMGKAA